MPWAPSSASCRSGAAARPGSGSSTSGRPRSSRSTPKPAAWSATRWRTSPAWWRWRRAASSSASAAASSISIRPTASSATRLRRSTPIGPATGSTTPRPARTARSGAARCRTAGRAGRQAPPCRSRRPHAAAPRRHLLPEQPRLLAGRPDPLLHRYPQRRHPPGRCPARSAAAPAVRRGRRGAGHPDGSTVDAEGCLWSTRTGGSAVVRLDQTGRVVSTLQLPVSQPTACAFGGPDLTTLYVTTARQKLTAEQLAAEPMAGDLFGFDVGVPGLPEHRFAG